MEKLIWSMITDMDNTHIYQKKKKNSQPSHSWYYYQSKFIAGKKDSICLQITRRLVVSHFTMCVCAKWNIIMRARKTKQPDLTYWMYWCIYGCEWTDRRMIKYNKKILDCIESTKKKKKNIATTTIWFTGPKFIGLYNQPEKMKIVSWLGPMSPFFPILLFLLLM